MIKYWLCILSVFILSCSEELETGSSGTVLASPYFPIEIGHKTKYLVTEITYFENSGIIDTAHYELEERIVDTYIDDADQQLAVIDRFTKLSSESNWTFQSSWLAHIQNNQAIRTEDNRRFIKLKLPLTQNEMWDGNSLFDDSAPIVIGDSPINYYKNWESRIVKMDEEVEILEALFSDVLTIELVDYENKLELREGMEMYAPGIGLIYKELRILDTQCFDHCDNIPWHSKAHKGHIYVQELVM